jgi:hypothetical protein
VNENPKNEKSEKTSAPFDKYEALTILYLQKQDLDGCSPEEIVGRYIEAQDRIMKEFARQNEIRKRRLNPLPL